MQLISLFTIGKEVFKIQEQSFSIPMDIYIGNKSYNCKKHEKDKEKKTDCQHFKILICLK